MGALEQIDKKALRDYLARGWLTHDGMWYFNVAQSLGAERANELNRAAIRSMAAMEMQRTKKLLGIGDAELASFEDFVFFFRSALEIVLPESVNKRFLITTPERNIVRWKWADNECFAYKGMQQIGLLDQYVCGVIYRIECWLDALKIWFTVEPKLERCVMCEGGKCSGEFRLKL